MKPKKIPAVLLTVGCFIFAISGCGKSACKPVGIDSNYKCHADMTQGDITYSADFQRGNEKTWKAVFTSPETIEGMAVTLSEENCSIDFKGISYSAPRSEFPQLGILNLFTSALEQCYDQSKVKSYKSGNVITQQGKIDGMDFKAEFKNNKLKKIDIGNNITIKIT